MREREGGARKGGREITREGGGREEGKGGGREEGRGWVGMENDKAEGVSIYE